MAQSSIKLRLTQKTAPTKSNGQSGNILSDVFPETVIDMSAVAFVLSRVSNHDKPILWVQDRVSRQEAGYPYLPGLKRPFIYVSANRPADLLWAIEDGLRCSALAGVIGEIWGDPPALSFTATKRLAMRAEAGGIPCWLIRRAAVPNLSAARNRWRVKSLPSTRHPYDPHAPGDPQWQADLFRARGTKPGTWIIRHDRAADRFYTSAAIRDGTVAARDGAAEHGATR